MREKSLKSFIKVFQQKGYNWKKGVPQEHILIPTPPENHFFRGRIAKELIIKLIWSLIRILVHKLYAT